jgi:aminomethyltransferase
LYGNELSEETNPLEAGLAWTVKLDGDDFLGKKALMMAKSEGLKRCLVGFEVTGRGSARGGYALLDQDGVPVGICTSGGPSPTLGRPIGLGYLPLGMTEIGTEFLVDARGKQLPAKVVKTPFYRRP